MAKQLVDAMTGEFDASQYRDEYREALLQVIQAKVEGEEIEAPEPVVETRGLTDALLRVIGDDCVRLLERGLTPSQEPRILCTGGFHVRLARDLGLPIRGNPWSEGDGLDLALERGGQATAGLDEFYGRAMPARIPIDEAEFVPLSQLYGQFAEAEKRFEPIYKQQCGKTQWGFKAWERLSTMSNLDNNVQKSRALAQAAIAKSCAVTEKQKVAEEGTARPMISIGYYIDAAAAYKKAESMPPGPERQKAWREAARLYKEALEKAPALDQAPEAAMNGAFR